MHHSYSPQNRACLSAARLTTARFMKRECWIGQAQRRGMKLLLEIILSILLHPVAFVLMLVDLVGRDDLSGAQKLLWAVVGLLWGLGEILYITLGDGALW